MTKKPWTVKNIARDGLRVDYAVLDINGICVRKYSDTEQEAEVWAVKWFSL